MIDINLILPKMENVKTSSLKKDNAQNTTKGQDNFLSKIKAYENVQNQETTHVTNHSDTKKVGKNKSLTLDKFTQVQLEESDNTLQDIASLIDIEAYQKQIMTALIDILKISKEEVEQILEELDIESIELLDQDNLTEFFNALYKDTPEKELLFNQETVENITQLTQMLNTISQEIHIDGKQILFQKIEIDDTVVATNATVINEEINLSEPYMEILKSSEYNIQPEKPGKVQIDTEQINKDAVEAIDFDENSLTLSAPKLQLGMDIPIYSIHNIESKIINNQASERMQHVSSFQLNIQEQIVNKIEINLLKNHQEVTMELTPKELGKLSLKLSETGGVITANIKVEKHLFFSQIRMALPVEIP
jgi:flagellar hook-length control protein FliK